MAKGSSTVSTSQIIASVADHFTELPKKVTKELLANFLETIESEIVSGLKIRLDKIGVFQVRDRKARKGRNPQTGEEISIPASKKIAFRVAKSLKEKVVGIKSTKAKKATSKAAPKAVKKTKR